MILETKTYCCPQTILDFCEWLWDVPYCIQNEEVIHHYSAFDIHFLNHTYKTPYMIVPISKRNFAQEGENGTPYTNCSP